MSADSRNWSVPNGKIRRFIGGPVGSNLKVGPPTNKFGAFIRKWWPPTERKMAEMHEPHKWKTNKNGLKRCLRSTPFVYLIKSIFWSSQRVSCHRIPIFPLYFFIHLLFFFSNFKIRARRDQKRAPPVCCDKKKRQISAWIFMSTVQVFTFTPCPVSFGRRAMAVNQTLVQTSASQLGAIFSLWNKMAARVIVVSF